MSTTLAEAVDNVPPVGKVYLPDSSYREMTEWALPTERLVEYQRIATRCSMIRDGSRCGHPSAAAPVNFRVKYPEADEMYTRMLQVSRRLQQTLNAAAAVDAVNRAFEQARTELYRGQCNCTYWHGAFGGLYLPHLRNAVYKHLIAADNLIESASGRPSRWVETAADDFNFDARQEVRLTSDNLLALLVPSRDELYRARRPSHPDNLFATLARRPEAYHDGAARG